MIYAFLLSFHKNDNFFKFPIIENKTYPDESEKYPLNIIEKWNLENSYEILIDVKYKISELQIKFPNEYIPSVDIESDDNNIITISDNDIKKKIYSGIGTISSDIYYYLSILYKINILLLDDTLKTDLIFVPEITYDVKNNYSIAINDIKKNYLDICINKYKTIIIILKREHAYTLYNPDEVEFYKTVRELCSLIPQE